VTTQLQLINIIIIIIIIIIMWKDVLQSYRPQMTIRHMRIAYWITKATHTHTHTHARARNM